MDEILEEYSTKNTIFGKDVLDLTDEEMDSIPVDIRKKLIKITLKTLKGE